MRTVVLSLLLAALAPAVAHANDVELSVQPTVPVGRKPTLTIQVNKDVAAAVIQLTGGSARLQDDLGAKAAGEQFVVELPHQKPGKVSWKGTLAVTFADDSKGSMPLSFGTEVVAGFRIRVKDEDVDLKEHQLVVTSERPTSKVDLEVYGDEGELLANTSKAFDNAKPGTPLTVGWIPKKAGDALRIRVTVHDPKSVYQSVDLYPYAVSIPHEEVEFETGKHDIRESEEPKLQAALAEIEKAVKRFGKALEADNATARLLVVGHTDTVGSAAANQALSERRAQAIGRWFAQRGVRVPVYVRGVGEGELKVNTPDETDEQRNRRVDYDVEAGPRGEKKPGWRRVN